MENTLFRADVRVGDTIEIGDGITLTVEKKSGQSARLAIRTPPAVKIRRLKSLPGVPLQTES